jgi:small subunit ribosomal protein S4
MKLFLKGERCYTEKCAIEKRNFPPGQHGKTRKAKLVGYGVQLREKQKVKRIYGVLEDQFRPLLSNRRASARITGETLLQLLERRLDNVIYRLGLCDPRGRRRGSWCANGHFLVNGQEGRRAVVLGARRRMIGVRESSRNTPSILHAIEEVKGRGIPEWLSFDANALAGRVSSLPTREQINLPVQEQLIVELYRSSW